MVAPAGWLWLRHDRAARGARSVNGDVDDVSDVRAELADLRTRVAASNRIAATAAQMAAAGPPAGANAVAAAPAPAPASSEAPPAKPPMSDEEVRARLGNRFNGEAADPAWGKPALSLLDNHIHAGLPDGSRVTSIECRRTMCRVESQHDSLDVYRHFVDDALLFPHGGWNGPVMTQIMNPGAEHVVSIAYLMREGEDFAPILEQ